MLKLNHLTGFGSGAAAAAAVTPTSYAFDGTGDYLSIPDHADWDLASSDWCFECFVRKDSSSGGNLITRWETSGDKSVEVHVVGGVVQGLMTTDGTTTTSTTGTTDIEDNAWHHVAYVRHGNVQYLYVDGVSEGTPGSESGALHSSSQPILIGAQNPPPATPGWFHEGYIDEIRISDVNRYPSGTGFAPTTTQFTSDANTLLLIHGGEAYTGALTDETTQSCVTLDGTGDYLSVPDHADWDFGTGAMTVEFWFKKTSSGTVILQYVDGSNWWGVWLDGKVNIGWEGGGVSGEYGYTHSITDGDWAHAAVGRDGSGNYEFWINGTSVGTDTDTDTFPSLASGVTVGSGVFGDIAASITELRVSDTERYTTGFTPQTTRHDSDANTLLLIHGDEYFTGNWLSGITGSGATFTDSGNTGHTVTEVGNAISARGGTFNDSGNTTHVVTENGNARKEIGAEYKFATDGVGYEMDGTGDYLSVADHADWAFGSGDFTMEMWANSRTAEVNNDLLSIQVDGNNRITLMNADNGGIKFRVWDSSVITVNLIQGARTTRQGIWYHVAIVRNGNEWDAYIDGVSVANITDSSSMPDLAAELRTGNGATSNAFDGYFDEIRISDVARYTTGFTPSTTQFTSDANTLLLIHCGETKTGTTGSGATFTDSGNTGHTVTENGNAIESTGNFYKF